MLLIGRAKLPKTEGWMTMCEVAERTHFRSTSKSTPLLQPSSRPEVTETPDNERLPSKSWTR